ncbi:hypothetical protein V6N11_081703 [Hibiscus sabdariffa]|uniref:RNase H type-1 domain-containing protein n=1 Tax=Hibiscus sabdariffa TaxID=183260 RepID=A0ABR2Q6X6_9ROSI
MVDAKGEWRWELLQHRLPTSILLRLAAIKRPMSFFPADSIGWRLRSDGRFSVTTAYQVARSNNSVADWLAKFASDTNFDVIFFESPPDGLVFG